MKSTTKNMGRFLRNFIYLFILFTICLPAMAQTKPALATPPPARAEWEEDLIRTNIEVSDWFDNFTEGVDLFLVGKRLTKERNRSSFRIDNTTTIEEGSNFANNTSISIKPRLQNLEEFMQLKFESYDEKETGRGVESRILRKTQRKKNYGATVGFFRKLGRVKTTFQPRITLQDPLKVAHSLAFESVADAGEFKMNPKLEFYADPDKGTGTFQAINFNYEFNEIYSATLINESEYQEKAHYLLVTNGVALGHAYSEKTGFTYSWIFSSANREITILDNGGRYHLDSHSVSVTWQQNIYRNILDFQLTPHLDFHKTYHWKGRTGLIFNVSVNF